MASFGPIAPHYDLLMANVPYDMWAGYYRLLLTREDVDPDSLLDVCCGTGTVAELMADAGYEVWGADISEAMVAEARRKEIEFRRGIQYVVADATTMDLGRTFQGAYSFFDSINYIATLEGMNAALRRVAAHLDPGGTFVFDVNTEYAFLQKMFDQQDHRRRAPIQYQWQGDYDQESKIIKVSMDFNRDGASFHETHIQRAHSDDEIRQGLAGAGFGRVVAYDSYTLDRPNKSSDRVHFVAVMP